MIEAMFELMLYLDLNHRPSSGVKLKLNELWCFTLESQINSYYEIKLKSIMINKLKLKIIKSQM